MNIVNFIINNNTLKIIKNQVLFISRKNIYKKITCYYKIKFSVIYFIKI